MSNKTKSEFLGMAYGTAMNRLRKALIFKMAQQLDWDNCYRCGLTIENIDDLSIEHKEPWLHKSQELFWDLDNIAFSHLRCNVKHDYAQTKLRKVGEEDEAWCTLHQMFLPISNFHKCESRWNGVQQICKDCKKVQDTKRVR